MYYRFRGGEDIVFEDEGALLRQRGHEVCTLRWHTPRRRFPGLSAGAHLLAQLGLTSDVTNLIVGQHPDIVHLHNGFPMLAQHVLKAARAARVPVVRTVHNYRVRCINGLLYRDGAPCTLCHDERTFRHGIRYRCHGHSLARSVGSAGLLALERRAQDRGLKPALFLTGTRFAKARLASAGLPADRIVVKPHFVPEDPGPGTGDGGYVLFAGRLAPEKGLRSLVTAWQTHGRRLPPVKVVGDGPLRGWLRRQTREIPGIEYLGRTTSAGVWKLMQGASAVVAVSGCYETFGRVIIEAYACGTPVIVAEHGAARELVKHGVTGLVIPPESPDALARAVLHLLSGDRRRRAMRLGARSAYEDRYTPDLNYTALANAYERAIAAS